MHTMSTYDNAPWAIDHIYSDDDRARNDARQILVDLELARYDEFSVAESDEPAMQTEIRARLQRALAARAVLGGDR